MLLLINKKSLKYGEVRVPLLPHRPEGSVVCKETNHGSTNTMPLAPSLFFLWYIYNIGKYYLNFQITPNFYSFTQLLDVDIFIGTHKIKLTHQCLSCHWVKSDGIEFGSPYSRTLSYTHISLSICECTTHIISHHSYNIMPHAHI